MWGGECDSDKILQLYFPGTEMENGSWPGLASCLSGASTCGEVDWSQTLVSTTTHQHEHWTLSIILQVKSSSNQYRLHCQKKNVAFFGFSFLVTIVDPNLADGEGDGDVRGERGHCSLCWMADVKVANGYVCDCGGFTVWTSHLPFSTIFNNFAFIGLLQKSRQIIFLAIRVEGHSRYCGWIRYILFDDA